MGFYATYCGFIYNEFVSMPLNLFGSSYNIFPNKNNSTDYEYGARKSEDCVYKFGLDPVWYLAKNELTFINSFKMKVAIILGVL